MKSNPSGSLRILWSCLLLLCFSLPLRAEQFGLFTYQVINDTTVTITDYPEFATGTATIPAEIAGKPVTSIGDSAFRNCAWLTSVTIPSSITTIGRSAFFNCTGLTSVTLPSSVITIGDKAFLGCPGLTSIHVEAGNPVYSSEDGVWLNATRTFLIQYPARRTGAYSLPSSVTSIGDFAFYNCRELTSVTIPSSVTSIGDSAFSSCTRLTSITIPSSVTNIGDSAFSDCGGLTSITIPSSVTSIGDSAFSDCMGLTSVTIPSSVTSIGDYAFSSCTRLTSITIPSSVTSIGYYAFSSCTGLTSVTIPSSVTTIGVFAFVGCSKLTSIEVEAGNPAYSNEAGVLLNTTRTSLIQCPGGKTGAYSLPSSVTSIGSSAFSGCIGLTSVIVPSSVTSIGEWAFYNCTGLTSVTIPSRVTFIGESAFSGCTGLTNVTIPSGVTFIRKSAFSSCTRLTNVTIPSSVTIIGDGAFYNCTGLTSVTIPSRVAFIGDGAFYGCRGLTSVIFPGNAPITGVTVFTAAAPGFTIYYLSSRSGFTSPTWLGYTAIEINETTWPAAAWLLEHGLWYDTGLNTDPDGDGVDLRTAWALKLDPRTNQASQVPVPVLNGNTLTLSFHASTPGFTYRAETSTDLVNWTTTGVTQSAPGPDGRSTATVALDAPARYLRLGIEG